MDSKIQRSPRRALPALAAALAAALTAAGCTGTPTASAPTARPPLADRAPSAAAPELRALYDQRIDWQSCGEPAEGGEPTVECATLKAPLDYEKPGGETIDVALTRVPAADQKHRLGALVLNPGGPGNSGTSMIQWGWKSYQGPLHDRYDLVGFDPRGAGRTTPVHCLDDRTRDEWTSTDDPGYDHGRVIADACQAKHAALLPHLGTRDTARDMDVLRSALGQRKLDFLGLSYGTYLGALYAEEFPERTGRLVLDGAVERSTDLMHLNGEQAVATEAEFTSFATDCATNDESCPFGTDPAAAPRRLAEFLDGLRARPLSTGDGRSLTAALAWGGVIGVLNDGSRSFERLREALAPAVTRGDADELMRLADNANGRDQDGRYDTAADAYAAIHCADAALAPSPADLRTALAALAAQAPLTSHHDTRLALLDPDCRPWPYRSPEKPHTVKAPGSAPILVVGSTGDPVTPYPWAQRMAAGFEHGVLLTRDGDGHTAWDKSGCVRSAVADYLVDGRMPAPGTRCASD
ncbi:alpha/beta hydrolase [Streptomyces sp. NRRL WC-3742]|uniref:alpha/beta hydrolase n=1 Tax=Streptomyces sp. NRRL WC-3742 TaxID=1463934 RepID=UPI00068BD7AA|nr:alpha/beta hydrolase [Streptomyces sp. NRRL WC-3742]